MLISQRTFCYSVPLVCVCCPLLLRISHGIVAARAGKFIILSNADMPVVAFALKPDEQRSFDEYDIMERLREYR